MTPAVTLDAYVKNQVGALIDGVVRESARAERDTSADGVHDLRVAIRRLSECLRVFESLFPSGAADAVRRDLRVAMAQAGEARNHDIAGGLLDKAGITVDEENAERRRLVGEELSAVLRGWNGGRVFDAWRERLGA